MESLNKSDEQKLLEGVKLAADYVDNKGMSPNDALVKVSQELSFLPGQARAAVNAFNNGRQLAQWKANTPVLDKLAEFPLADFEVIKEQVWGGSTKNANDYYTSPSTSIHADYSQEPKWVNVRDKQALASLNIPTRFGEEKSASSAQEVEAQSQRSASRAWSDFDMSRRTYEDLRSKHAAANDHLGVRVNILANYFKKFAHDRLEFDVVEKAASVYYGSKGQLLMDVIAERFPKEKRAADTGGYCDKPLDRNQEPFTLIKSAVDAARSLCDAQVALDNAKQAMDNAKEALNPFSQAPSQTNQESTEYSPYLIPDADGAEKEAGKRGLWDNIHAKRKRGEKPAKPGDKDYPDAKSWKKTTKEGSGLLTGALIGGASKPLMESIIGGEGRDKAVAQAEENLGDPEHENELRKIKAQVMLADMMSDTDNPISGYDPEEVLEAYNNLSQLAPRLADQPAAVQPLLAKRLAGNTEPFEIKEISDIEKSIAQTDKDVLKNDSLL